MLRLALARDSWSPPPIPPRGRDLDAEQREEVRTGAGDLLVGTRQLHLEVVHLLLQLARRRRPPCCPPLEIEKKI